MVDCIVAFERQRQVVIMIDDDGLNRRDQQLGQLRVANLGKPDTMPVLDQIAVERANQRKPERTPVLGTKLCVLPAQQQPRRSMRLQYEPTEPGQDPRHCGTVEPTWNLLDLTPDGRPSADEQFNYGCCH
jgi:hypothetical protein